VRNLLDMRSGIKFSEDYLDPLAEVRLIEQAIGWAPRTVPDLPTTMYDFLLTLQQKSPHGGPFEYRSCETDVLGWVCEAAGGLRMPELMSQLLWSRLGARNDATIGVDSVGTGMFDGGINTCPVGPGAVRFAVPQRRCIADGRAVVSLSWIADTLSGGLDSRAAFAASPGDNRMPGGMYRNQFWFPSAGNNVLLCIGIHGQMIYVNRAANMVARNCRAGHFRRTPPSCSRRSPPSTPSPPTCRNEAQAQRRATTARSVRRRDRTLGR
jgi:CubicO group peptidase (beta-lactamase class C family)